MLSSVYLQQDAVFSQHCHPFAETSKEERKSILLPFATRKYVTEGRSTFMSDTSVLDISERAQKALRSSPISALRNLRVSRHGDGLVISGSVSTFYHKQLAQEAVRTVAEDISVVNSIRVE